MTNQNITISDIHRLNISSREPVPNTADLHGRPDQVVQGAEDRGAAPTHLRDRRQCLRAHASVQAGPVHRHQWRIRCWEDGVNETDPAVPCRD